MSYTIKKLKHGGSNLIAGYKDRLIELNLVR